MGATHFTGSTTRKQLPLLRPNGYWHPLEIRHRQKACIDFGFLQSKHEKVAKPLSPRIWSGKHPSRSFYKIAQDLYISTPEATFLQLGKELGLIQLITVGYELCGSYGLSAQSSSGFLRREPRSNPPAHRTLSREMRRNSRGQGGETSIELPHQRVRLPNGKLAFDASLSSSFVGRIWLAPPGA